MKALTLTQPWATLVILGVKGWETRSWRPRDIAIGAHLAIHAAKGWTRDDVDFAFDLAARGVLPLADPMLNVALPRGAVLGTVVFTGYRPTRGGAEETDLERELGDWTPGRWAWGLANPRAFATPVPARRALGLWTWERQDR